MSDIHNTQFTNTAAADSAISNNNDNIIPTARVGIFNIPQINTGSTTMGVTGTGVGANRILRSTTTEKRLQMKVSCSPTDRLMSPCTKQLSHVHAKRNGSSGGGLLHSALGRGKMQLLSRSKTNDDEDGNGDNKSTTTDSPTSSTAMGTLSPFTTSEEAVTTTTTTSTTTSTTSRFAAESVVAPMAYPGGDLEFILGTSSINRKQIVDALGWSYTQMSPDIDEKAIRDEDPLTMPLLIAKAKAEALVHRLNQEHRTELCLILTSDQIVLFQNQEVREKPESREQAIAFLSSYSNASVDTISAVVITHYPTKKQVSSVHKASVQWKEIPYETVIKVVDKGLVLSSAGGFQIEDVDLSPLIVDIEGGADSVMGLPVECTILLMEELRDILTNMIYEEDEEGNA